MLRIATCLCVLQVLLALRDLEVAHLIPDEPTFIDTPTVPASSAIVTASEEVPQVQDLKVDLSKMDLEKVEELPNCSGGELRLSAKFYKATRHLEIQGPCNVTADGATLLVTTTLKFVETAHLDGKLSVRAMNAFQGPCLAFKSDAFVAASAELHFENCHNIVQPLQPKDDIAEAAEDGGAMNVRGSLMVMGTLIIRDCRTKHGKGGAIAVQHFFHSNGSISIINSSARKDGGAIYVEQNFNHTGGDISVQGSSAVDGGAIYVKTSFHHSGGNISVEGSSAENDGGAIYVNQHFAQSGGSLAVMNSSGKEFGGSIYVTNFHHSGGDISVQGSSAEKYGGAIYVNQHFAQSGGSLAVMNSSGKESGGAIFVTTSFNHSGGDISVEESSARWGGGGAIYVVRHFAQSGGSLAVMNSWAKYDGGAIYVKQNFTQSGGSLAVMNSSGKESGGAIYVKASFNHSGGNISVEGSSAEKHGGAIYVKQHFAQSGGSLAVMNSSAKEEGGAIYVVDNFNHSGGDISVEGSSAGWGGAIYVVDNFNHPGGDISVEGSSAGWGGAIYVKTSFNHSGGNISVEESSAEWYGGAIFVKQNFTQSGGSLAVMNLSAKESGGAIYVNQHFAQSGGSLAVMNSSAQESGGAIYVSENFHHSGGNISVQETSAEEYGGAIFVRENFAQSGGSLAVVSSSAKWTGGAIYVSENFHHSGGDTSIAGSETSKKDGGAIYVKKHFAQSGGSLAMMNSSAKGSGGGFYVVEHMVFTNAMATFSQCHAGLGGGGIKTSGNVSITNASLSFELATADDRGAVLQGYSLEQVGGRMTVYNSYASGASGDVIDVAAWAIDGGSFRIEHCKAKGLLLAAKSATLNATSFDVADCSAAGMLVSSSQVLLRNSVFNKTSLPQVRAPVVDASNCSITGSEAWISAEKAIVKDIDCDVPFGTRDEGDGLGCKSCESGTLFVKNLTMNTIQNRSAIQRCVPCPDGAKICNATAVEMMPGRMVELSNLSRSFHCPNQLACRGGAVSSNVLTLMCAGGYEGEGCSQCAEGCARSDSNVFICVRCADELLRKVKDVLVFLLSNTLLFVVSAAGVINAQGRNKNSAVYLNQLMSFAAVTAPALLALQQTGTFNEKLQQLQQTMTWISIPVQAGDAGESSISVSTECLQRYMGMEPSLMFSQLISSLLYIFLMLCLALKSGHSIAGVVGVNCFLPKVCATFGCYLIIYRMEPLGERLSLLEAQHRVAGMAIAVLAIILCFMVGPGSWVKMTRDKSVIDKPHVLFLTRSYREGFETWEVEKLIRRMLLKVISTIFPITLNPSMQMAGVTLVLMASYTLHVSQAPYAKEEWNHIELGLLATALVIVVLTTLCLANEMHWAHSDEVQITLILGITGIVSVAGGLQSFLLGRELLRERRSPPETNDAAKAPEEDGEESNS